MHEPEDDEPFRVTASLGVVTLTPGVEMTLEQFMQKADEALYRAKERGRNRVEMGLGGATRIARG
jgi:diguanylate cyclase (GGDEF)-like protein